MIGTYRIITLCGSTRFKESFLREQKRLTLEGNIVISVGCFGHSGDKITDEQKFMLDDMHKRKIDMADEIFVINVGGYIGSSTKSEILYAKSKNKPVTYLEPSDIDKVIQNKVNGICDDCDQDATMCYLKGNCIYHEKKTYKNCGMSVENRILTGMCEGCDQDPTKCHTQGYCEYDKEEIK